MRPYTSGTRATLNHFAPVLIFVSGLVLTSALELNSQQLQKGVSVNLAPTTSAQPMPAADDADAWIVSISADGNLWFGVIPVTPESLLEKMIQTPRNRRQNLYIKADVRAPYSAVVRTLKAARTDGFDAPIFLTGQPTSPESNGLLPPMGLQVGIEHGGLTTPEPINLDIVASQASSVLRVNNQEVSWTNLQGKIQQLAQNQTGTVVRLSAEGNVPFGQIIRAVDASQAANAKVIMGVPEI